MYNDDLPTKAVQPTARQLLRSTLIALASAIVILVTLVLPGEYGIDPTGVGRVLGLTEMGEIKTQLSREAEADRRRGRKNVAPPGSDQGSSLFGRVFAAFFVAPAAAQVAQAAPTERSDEVTITLKPGQGAEIKLVMKKGAKAQFTWTVANGVVNYDLHGDGGGRSISYKKGRGVPKHEGTLTAAFDGNHGWFWRNRTRQNVTVILRVKGAYAEIKRLV